MKSKAAACLAVLLAAAGCGAPEKPESKPAGAEARPKATAAERAEAVRGNSRFALELYAKLAGERKGEDLFLSPYSISTALAMTCGGARGKTAAQMRKVLCFTLKDERLHPAMGALTGDLNEAGRKGKFKLSVANALWGQKGYRFLPVFLALNRSCYRAGLELVDFKRDAEGARRTINAWVEKKTEDKIKELIRPGILDRLTRLVLTNAIYFKADWASRFDKKKTRDAPFRLASGKTVQVPTMDQTRKFKHLRADGFSALELPYVGGRLAMVIFLPEKAGGLAGFEKKLTTDKLQKWLSRLTNGRVWVRLPRFKMTSEFRLHEVLKGMGMTDAFTMKADFSGIESSKWLYINAVIHKTFTEVNEEGTEAAAATAVVMKPKNGGGTPTFWAHHPFLFLIRDRKSGSILFLGRVTDPRP